MVYVVIFILWGLYRLLLRFPIVIEELFFKPIIFLPPALSMLEKEKQEGIGIAEDFGFRKSRLMFAIYFGVTLGITYFLVISMAGLVIFGWKVMTFADLTQTKLTSILLVAAATAVWEQLIFSGFMLLRFQRALNDEWKSASLTALLFSLLHFPVMWLDPRNSIPLLAIQLMLFFLVGFGNSVLMLRTRNVVAPILSHAFLATALQILS